MISENSLQNTYIANLIKNQSLISVFLTNSIRLKGYLIAHSDEAVFLRRDKTIQLIYKDKISTFVPERVFATF